jgi:hypothetical protein
LKHADAGAQEGRAMRPLIFILALLFLTGCAGTPKAPSCQGPYRSLNPSHYDPVKETAHADVAKFLEE